nr:hypothetical protein [Tanacetum cinerariifolium]
MKIPKWMLTDEMKLTDHYWMYATVFPNLEVTEGEYSAQRKPTMIRFRLPPRLQDPEMPIPIAAEIDNVEKVKEHMLDEELEQLLERTKNVDVDAFMDNVLYSQEDPSTRIEPMSGWLFMMRTHIAPLSLDKETLQELTVATENAPSFADKEKLQELTVTDSTPSSASLKPKTRKFRRHTSFIQQMGRRYGCMFAQLKKLFLPRKKFHQVAKHLHSTIEEFHPLMVGDRVNEVVKKIVPLYVAKGLLLDKQKTQVDVAVYRRNTRIFMLRLPCKLIMPLLTVLLRRTTTIRPRDYENHQDDAHPEGDNSAKRQKTFKHGTYTVGESSSEQHMDQEPNPSDSGTKKYTLSLHKYPTIPFPDDDIKARTSRWVSKRLKKFNVYARYGVEHWKNMWAKKFHIRSHKEKRDKPEEVYSDSKIVEVIRTSYELGHEHKFIKELIMRRANGKIDPIT